MPRNEGVEVYSQLIWTRVAVVEECIGNYMKWNGGIVEATEWTGGTSIGGG